MTKTDDRLKKDDANASRRVGMVELLAIVGPTASGKSALALRLAKKYKGEIIAADSRTIYKGMDIGTAKPTVAERAALPHWGLDLVEPGQAFSAAHFKCYAETAIKDIQGRGKLPILVGGTGLYVDGLLFDFGFGPPASPAKRGRLEALTTEQLRALINKKAYPMPENFQNRRHLIRALERRGRAGSARPRPAAGVRLIGLLPPDEVLRRRIDQRAEAIFAAGVVAETGSLIKQYGPAAVSATAGIVYKIAVRVLAGEITEAEAIERFKTADWRYARRQRTWFRRNSHINWFETPEAAYQFAKTVVK